MLKKIRMFFHSIGIILSVILLFIDDPGFDSIWIWTVGAIIINAVLLIPIVYDKRCHDNVDK